MDNELLVAYPVHDEGINNDYRNGFLKKIEGDSGDPGFIDFPDETYVPIGPTEGGPRVFSYALGRDPAVLVAKVNTPQGQPVRCKYTLATPGAGCGKAWKILARDIVLKDAGTDLAANPYGVAQAGNMFYIIDYDSKKITLLGVNELNGKPPGDYYPDYPPFDVGSAADLPANAQGQAIVALTDPGGDQYLYALYTTPNQPVYPSTFGNSILVKLQILDEGSLIYVDKADTLAKNAQDIIYVNAGGVPSLFIPAIGGPQRLSGDTNGTEAALDEVDPFTMPMTVTRRVTGDDGSAYPHAWDIRAFAAPRSGDSNTPVYLMTGTMGPDRGWNWGLYRTAINSLRNLNSETISQALNDGALTQIVDDTENSGGAFWDIFYETGTASSGSRLWLLQGSPLRISPAADYDSPYVIFDVGFGPGQLGGRNVGSAVFIPETLRQADSGLSLKRGLRGIPPYIPI
ncbi:MAG: hypothetical protein LBE10_11665 [Treponema sp.]|jgi:hypothetical protein|nr:hypothetical protein [Treponema sp.]